MTVEIVSWSISTKVWDRAGIELATPESAVRLASVARHATDCAVIFNCVIVVVWPTLFCDFSLYCRRLVCCHFDTEVTLFFGQNVNSESIHVSGTLEAHKTHAGGFISKQATIPTLVGRSVSKHYGFFLIIFNGRTPSTSSLTWNHVTPWLLAFEDDIRW